MWKYSLNNGIPKVTHEYLYYRLNLQIIILKYIIDFNRINYYNIIDKASR